MRIAICYDVSVRILHAKWKVGRCVVMFRFVLAAPLDRSSCPHEHQSSHSDEHTILDVLMPIQFIYFLQFYHRK